MLRLFVFLMIALATETQLFTTQLAAKGQDATRATIARSPIQVSWELITNFTETPQVFQARFEFSNTGQQVLGDTGWALYFNMAPRAISPHPKPQAASIEHLNGDWYRLVPNPGFELPPGQKLEIQYRGIEAVIKESDAPQGLYFVMNEDLPEQPPRIERVSDYHILPFEHPEQINRGPNDQHPIPTPEVRFRENSTLQLLPIQKLPPITPTPVNVRLADGLVKLTSDWQIVYCKDSEVNAGYLAKTLSERWGIRCRTALRMDAGSETSSAVRLSIAPLQAGQVSREAYRLSISDAGIDIIGNDAAGVFYAIQSLLNLVPLKAYRSPGQPLDLSRIEITDAPRFGYRGLHVDVSRNFQSKETVERILDVMALYKLNRLLLYTTEDEGWRLEIPGLPELTSVGGQRQHISAVQQPSHHPAYGSGPEAYGPKSHGSGYYTRDEFIQLLKYAAARHIKIIPEVNFPGHARAAIKAMESRYARLMQANQPAAAQEFRLIDPSDSSEFLSAQFYKDNVVSVARDSTYRFYQKVLDELSAMYREAGLKMDEIHTGGDEIPVGAWTQSPLAAKLLDQHPEIGGVANLQTCFFRRLLSDLDQRGVRALGWEEVFQRKNSAGQAEPNPEFAGRNVVAYIWNNLFDFDLGNRLANAGYPVVLCNVSNFYFDLAYDKDPQEPGLYWAGFVGERDAWTFAPYNYAFTTFRSALGQPIDIDAVEKNYQHLKPEAYANILGVQAQLWSETIKGREMIEYYMLPKLIGFAESAWAAPRPWETIADRQQREQSMAEGWNVMANCIGQRELPRLSWINGGYNYRVPPPGGVIEGDLLKANVSLPGLKIRYTTGGSPPDEHSPVYSQPVTVHGPVALRTFDIAGRSSRAVQVQPVKRP